MYARNFIDLKRTPKIDKIFCLEQMGDSVNMRKNWEDFDCAHQHKIFWRIAQKKKFTVVLRVERKLYNNRNHTAFIKTKFLVCFVKILKFYDLRVWKAMFLLC